MTTEVVVVNETNTVVTENTVTNVVEVMAVGTTATVDVIAEGPAGPPGGQVMAQDEGVDVALLDGNLNFVGSMVNVTNNPATETVTVTVTAPSPTISLTGAVTGSGTMTNLGNVSIATTATADPTLTLAGDATGSATFTNLGDATLTVTVVDDSHNHIISNVDGLQDALDSKLPSASYTAADVLTKIKTVDGIGSGLDADLLDGQSGAYYNDFTNATNKPDPTITLSGDATGSVTLTDLASGTLSVTVVDDSHNHIISNVDGLQDALDAKAPLASPTFTGTVTLPSTTSVGTVSATEISYLDGVTSGIQSQIDSKLPSSSYTAADVLTKIKTVDGAGSGLDADLLDGQSSAYYTAINDRLGYTAENAANKGIANGYASLDGAGLVPSTQLPSYVDDVVEYANVAAFPATGVSGVIYVAIDTSKTYRWSGSTYVEISASPGTTDALTEGTVNLYFTTARARQSVSAGTGISYNNSTGVITNSAPDQTVALTAGTGISTSGTYPNFTITNSAPDQTVALTAGTGISTSGTYPNFTITNAAPDQTVVLTAGTGISTSGTYPNFTITNSAPDQTVALTGAGTTSISGTYPNFTISSADQYVGTVTSVAVSGGTTGLTVTGSPITSSGTITIGGTLVVANGGTGATTAPNARTNLGAAASGANTDITSLTGITGGISTVDYITYDTAVNTTPSAGQVGWNTTFGTNTRALGNGTIILDGMDLVAYCANAESTTLVKGEVVYIFGATGSRASVKRAINNGDINSAMTIGFVKDNISAGQSGYIVTQGVVDGLNLGSYTAGDIIYLGSTAGTFTNVKPYAPNHIVILGVVERANSGNGQIYVKVSNGWELEELHNVAAQSPTNGQTIVYNSTSDLWEKNTVSLTAGVNGTLPVANGGTGQTSFTNGQLLIGNTTGNTLSKATLTAGTNVSITNGSGSITINATDQYVGTVTSVAALTIGTTGTDLSSTVANGTTTPVITLNVPTASASNRGALSSTDWSTFNGKQAALVSGSNIKTVGGTSLLGSGDLGTIGVAYGGTGATSLTSGYLLKGNGTSAVSASVVYDDGTNVGIGTASPTTLLDAFSATAANLSVRGNSATNITAHRSSTDATGPNLVLRKSRGTSASQTAVATGDNMGTLVFSAFGGTNNRNIATIASNVEYYVSDSLLSSNLIFSTTSVSTTPTEVMRIDSSGNVGIATASPGAKLDVVAQNAIRATGSQPFLTLRDSGDSNKGFRIQTASGATLFSNDSTGGGTYTERMRIDASGNVGIGTNSPGSILHAVASGAELRAQNTNTGQYYSGRVRLKGPAGTYRSTALVHGNNNVGGTNTYFAIEGADSSDNYLQTLALYDYASQFWGFSTNSSEKMRIDSSGNVGIGTSAPGSKLDINGGLIAGGENRQTHPNVGPVGFKAQWNYTGGNGETDFYNLYSIATRSFRFYQSTGNGTAQLLYDIQPSTHLFYTGGNERMRIDSSGNVGIGTSSPQGLLHVVAGTNDTLIFRGPINLGTGGSIYAVNSANSAVTPMEFGASTYYFAGGNVGIGTSSPSQKLTLQGAQLIIPSAGWSSGQVAYMYLGDTSNGINNTNGAYQTYFAYNGHNWLVNGTEAMRIDGARSVGIGTTTPQCIFNVKTGTAWVQNYSGSASSPSETVDWPVPAITATSYGNFTLQTMMAFALPNDGNYFTGDSVWTLRLEQTASSTTSAGVQGMRFIGPGYLSLGAGQNERMRITSGGDVGIGASSLSGKLHVETTGTGDVIYIAANTGGSAGQSVYVIPVRTAGTLRGGLQWNGTNLLYNNSSDARLKDNVADADDAASLIDAIQVRKFDWKESGSHQRYGFIAQELVEVAPEAVHQPEDEEEMMGVDYSKLVPMLIKEVQSLRARVAELEGK